MPDESKTPPWLWATVTIVCGLFTVAGAVAVALISRSPGQDKVEPTQITKPATPKGPFLKDGERELSLPWMEHYLPNHIAYELGLDGKPAYIAMPWYGFVASIDEQLEDYMKKETPKLIEKKTADGIMHYYVVFSDHQRFAVIDKRPHP